MTSGDNAENRTRQRGLLVQIIDRREMRTAKVEDWIGEKRATSVVGVHIFASDR